MKRILIAATLLASTGCAGAVVTCPRVENPVLLGPVDRIGGPARTTPNETNMVINADNWLSISEFHVLGGRTAPVSGSIQILDANPDPRNDVHVTKIQASGFAWDSLGVFWMQNELRVELAVPKREVAR